ncbi:DUF6056 family protein [[Kitasatospora] papulosa]|uniref:DUF6056 family protein n=1 Tax=[Kitasatospora] papulosa TaxID=1464011 RepID=UPI003631F68B
MASADRSQHRNHKANARTADDVGTNTDASWSKPGAIASQPVPASTGRTLLVLLPLALFGAASWFARWVRPSGDEWCFLPIVRDDGFVALVDQFYSTDNGRIANGVLVASYASFGVAGQQWYAAISSVVILALLWAWASALFRCLRWRVPRGIPLFSAAILLAVFCFGSVNTYKTFFWPASSVSHTFPPVLAAAATIPALLATSRRGKAAATASAFILGAVMGTLSEETSVVALCLLAMALLLSRRLFSAARLTFVRTWCAAAGAGILIGTAVLLTSPGSRNRRTRHHADSMFAPESLLASLRGYAHVLYILGTNWQYLCVIAVGVLIGVLARGADGRVPRPNYGTRLLLVSAAVAFVFSGYVCTVIARPAFGPSVSTANRLWNDYLFLLLLLLTSVGGLLGNLIAQRYRPQMKPVAIAAALVCVALTAVLATSLRTLETDMRVRAETWDSQDHLLREQAAAGATVLPYTPLVVSKMSEPFGNHGKRPWPASCVATYYRVEKITDGRVPHN